MKKNIKNIIIRSIIWIAHLAKLDLQQIIYQEMGILNYQNSIVSGEDFLINKFLKTKIKHTNPIFFDVGANKGDYSTLLKKYWPTARIIAVEPNKEIFPILKEEAVNKQFEVYNIGFSDKKEETDIFFYEGDKKTQHASIYPEVFSSIHRRKDVSQQQIQVTTIDLFCEENSINYIDFLKIDTEGHELSVLAGAKKMIKENNIGIIQFEFNEMNIIPRIFMKDFYEALPNYSLYRLKKNNLTALGSYRTKNEIFKFQNIVAVLNN